MIVRKKWHRFKNNDWSKRINYEGWFLLGFIPLYVIRYSD
jgi:hypothetical protein